MSIMTKRRGRGRARYGTEVIAIDQRPPRRRRPPEPLPKETQRFDVLCWCMAKTVKVTGTELKKARTGTCGTAACEAAKARFLKLEAKRVDL